MAMTKDEILSAINSTIVANGAKGITAESLNNILTEMVGASGEGGSSSGDGALRIMVPDPMFIQFAAMGSGKIITEFSADTIPGILSAIEELYGVSLSETMTTVFDEMFTHNATAYATLIEKSQRLEAAPVILDYSKSLKVIMQALGDSVDFVGIYHNAIAFSSSFEGSETITISPEPSMSVMGTSITFYPEMFYAISAAGGITLDYSGISYPIFLEVNDSFYEMDNNIKIISKEFNTPLSFYSSATAKFPYPMLSYSINSADGFSGKFLIDTTVYQIDIPADTGIPTRTALGTLNLTTE